MPFNRYGKLSRNGKVMKAPFVRLSYRDTDYYVKYERGKSRLDLLSYDYYGDPSYEWLILMANPSISGLEYTIPDNASIRIPLPLSEVIEEYNNKIDAYNVIYGLD